MIRAFPLALGDLSDPRILAILVRTLVLTLLIFAGIALLLGYALTGFDPCALLSDEESCPFGASAGGLGALILTAIALWFLFPAIAIGVVSAYMDRIVAVVEARHYPEALSTARPLGWARGALLGLQSSLRVLVYNLVALPFYIVLLVTGVGTVLLFVVVNGIAFGRDLGEMVAVRHISGEAKRRWLRATRSDRALVGAAVTGVFLVPFVNLLAPVLGAAMATHLFHGTERKAEGSGTE
jgi:CysZ protein